MEIQQRKVKTRKRRPRKQHMSVSVWADTWAEIQRRACKNDRSPQEELAHIVKNMLREKRSTVDKSREKDGAENGICN